VLPSTCRIPNAVDSAVDGVVAKPRMKACLVAGCEPGGCLCAASVVSAGPPRCQPFGGGTDGRVKTKEQETV